MRKGNPLTDEKRNGGAGKKKATYRKILLAVSIKGRVILGKGGAKGCRGEPVWVGECEAVLGETICSSRKRTLRHACRGLTTLYGSATLKVTDKKLGRGGRQGGGGVREKLVCQLQKENKKKKEKNSV